MGLDGSCSGLTSCVGGITQPWVHTLLHFWCFRSEGRRLLVQPGGGKDSLSASCVFLDGWSSARWLMTVTSLVLSVQ